MKTLYEVLEISHNAEQLDIKKAFRERSFELHPDYNPDVDTSRDFRILIYAYEVLSDSDMRARYDQKLKDIGKDLFTLYDILEIHNSASIQDVKKSFKKLAFLFHPDISGDSATTKYFRMIYYANSVLSNEEDRNRYDQKIAQFGFDN